MSCAPLCRLADSFEDMVQCDECTLWFHYGCAGLAEAPQENNWYCPICTKVDKQKSRRSKRQHGNILPY